MGNALRLVVAIMCVAITLLSMSSICAREIEPCICTGDSMDCSFRERTVVGPGEVCGGIRKINLRGNFLPCVPDGMKNIIEIDISKNLMKNLPDISKVSDKIKILDVSSNEIQRTYNELAPLSALEVLYVRENSLSTLDFLPHQCALKKLDGSLNVLSKIDGPLEQCDVMEMLVLSHNNLVTLPEGVFSQMAQLETLDLSSNRLVQICSGLFEGLYSLKYLRLSKNRLTSLPTAVFSKLPQLADLDLSDNPLTKVAAGVFDGLGQVQSITMGVRNPMALPSGLFIGTGRLQKLTLDIYNLTSIPQDIFKPLRHLEKLDVLSTRLFELPLGLLTPLVQLKTLNVIGSQLRLLPDGLFSGLHSLGVIDMRANRLQTLPVLEDCCEGLWYADFSKNNITDLSEPAVRSLVRSNVTLHLRGNPLRPDGLTWVVMAADLHHFVEDVNCSCGGLQRGSAIVDFCVDARCNKGAGFRDWVSAVRATSPDAL